MNRLISITVALAVTVACGVRLAGAQPVPDLDTKFPRTPTSDTFLGPPTENGPVVVEPVSKLMRSAPSTMDGDFRIYRRLTLRWRDKRQAFNPAEAGVDEKIYQGDYQFNEIAPSWFPQVVLVNSAGSYESRGVVLRVQPDASQTLIEKIIAAAKTELNLRRFPFDRQSLKAVFEVLGFDDSEVVLRVESGIISSVSSEISIPQWTISGMSVLVRDRPASYAGRRGVASAFITTST